MPQLDIYILHELVENVLILWGILFLLNIRYLLLNIFLSLKTIKLKFFVEKQLLKKIFKEINIKKNNKYLKKIILILKNLYLNIKNKIFLENLLDIYSFNIKIYNIILKRNINNKIILKNNIELYRIFI